jgi:16S rRNA (cytidine1402-2'-O)-methyltransferase
VVAFESPRRLPASLRALAALAPDRPAAVCRELTKLHEQVVRGPLTDLADLAATGAIPARGELVIVVGWGSGEQARTDAAAAADQALAAARADVERLAADGVPRGKAARRVAAASGIPRRSLYGGRGGR